MKTRPNTRAYALFAVLFVAGFGKAQTSSKSTPVELAKTNGSGTARLTRYESRPGSKVRIEGISTRSDWQVESSLLGGFLEVGANFPTEPGQSARSGKVEARAEVFVLIHSLKSVEKGGHPFSDEMDKMMYGKLHAQEDPRAKVSYHLTELVLRETPVKKDEPYVFDSKGELAIAGVTNIVTMPLNILPLGEKRLRISGAASMRMTEYKIQPPALTLPFGPLKTGDEVKLIFEWVVAQKSGPAAPAGR